MFKTLFPSEFACRRHCDAPFAEERDRYLRYCLSVGATRSSLIGKACSLRRLAGQLESSAAAGVDLPQLRETITRCMPGDVDAATLQHSISIGRRWLQFLGWWRVPIIEVPHQDQLDRFVMWMRDERGFSSSTVSQWQQRAARFLRWCGLTNRALGSLRPTDIDQYFREGSERWSRLSAYHMASSLRMFLRYVATQGACDPRLADTIQAPRVYELEGLPVAPSWSDVQRLLDAAASDDGADIRDRAILMLLAIYGMRSGEVAALRLDQIDWSGRVLRLFRLKRRQVQVYPLLPSVAEALARYIDTTRPVSPHAEVFIGMQAPQRPISPAGIYCLVRKRFIAAGIRLARMGPHALRHACATRLMAEGLTLKEIGDHLGHRSTSATRVYTKVDLASLREVGEFDLGGLQ